MHQYEETDGELGGMKRSTMGIAIMLLDYAMPPVPRKFQHAPQTTCNKFRLNFSRQIQMAVGWCPIPRRSSRSSTARSLCSLEA